MPTATTLVDVLRDLNRDLGQAIGQVPLIGTTSSAGNGGGTTLIDAVLTLPDAPTGLLDGAWFRVDGLISGGPASGTSRIIRKAGFDGTTGTITIAAAGAQVKSLTPYSIWRPTHPATALLFVQQAMRLFRIKSFYPWSLLTNPDFAAVTSGAGPDSWTATNLTQTTTAGYTSTDVRHGVYAARALLSAGAGKLRSNTVNVVPGDQYIASVALRAAVGTGIMRIVDITNSTALAGTVDIPWAGRAWVEAEQIPFYIPATTKQIAMELAGTNSADDISFDDAVLWQVDKRDYVLPSWVEDPADIDAIGYFPRGRLNGSGANAYTYDLDSGDFVSVWERRSTVDEGAGNPFRVRLGEYHYRPLYIYGGKPPTVMSADTDTTTLDRTLLVKMATWLCFDSFATTAATAGRDEERLMWLERRENVGRDARLAGALSRFMQENFTAQGLEFGRA